MTSAGGSTRYDCERNTDPKGPANLEQRPKCRKTKIFRGDERVGDVEREAGYGSYAGEDIEEDACGFGHAFAEDARAMVLKIEFTLGDGFGGDDMAGKVLLDSFCSANFKVVGAEPG